MTQESHERVKRGMAEASGVEPETKKPRIVQMLEQFPEEIVCIRRPIDVGEETPRVMFSQVQNHDGLLKAVT